MCDVYEIINNHLKNNKLEYALQECRKNNKTGLGSLLSLNTDYFNIDVKTSSDLLKTRTPNIRVKLYCNWLTSEELCNLWNKMSKGNYTWNNIEICWEGKYDYQVIINSPHSFETDEFNLNKTILFRMEPHMDKNMSWGFWTNPDPDLFLKFHSHESSFNNCEWHISKTYNELMESTITKNDSNIISTILSSKYTDPGHKLRVDFIKFLDTKEDVHVDVYGHDLGYKNYKRSLPYHKKDDGLIPYRYTFNVENFQIDNYN